MKSQRHQLRVVFLSGSFAPREGGAERQMRQVLALLSRSGAHCTVLTQCLSDSPRREVMDGVLVRRLGSTTAFSHSRRLGILSFFVAATVAGMVARPTVLLSSMLGSASVSAALLARVYRVPHILRLTGGGTEQFRSEPMARRVSAIGRAWCKLFDQPDTVIVAPAAHLLRDYEDAFTSHRNQKMQIDNGVACTSSTAVSREVVAYYARGSSQSNDGIFRELAQLTPRIAYEAFGRVLDPAPSNVTSRGWISTPERFLGSCRVLVNTSRYEGSPNTALQALASGCYVVGFLSPGMEELARRFPDRVLLCTYGDVVGLSALIQSAITLEPLQKLQIGTIEDSTQKWSQLIERQRTS